MVSTNNQSTNRDSFHLWRPSLRAGLGSGFRLGSGDSLGRLRLGSGDCLGRLLLGGLRLGNGLLLNALFLFRRMLAPYLARLGVGLIRSFRRAFDAFKLLFRDVPIVVDFNEPIK